MTYQPNNGNAHDHTYPVTSEEQSYFDVKQFPERITQRMKELEAEVQALRQALAQTNATLHRYLNCNEND